MRYLLCLAMAACGAAQLTTADKTELARREAAEQACIVANAPNKAAIDACIASVRAASDARLDAGAQ